MREKITLSGVVLSARPVGEYDRRLVILTKERGRITAFAHGARRSGNALMAVSNPFVFAEFTLYEGRDAYSLISAVTADYFTDLAAMLPGVFYGYYFLEMADYFGREGVEAAEEVNLIYVTLKAVMRGELPLPLVRAVFEIRMLSINGEYAPPEENGRYGMAAYSLLIHACSGPLTRLYAFAASEEAQAEFEKAASEAVRVRTDRRFKSLAVIEKIE